MNCYNHPNTPAAAYCRSCGRPLCPLCQRNWEGVIYCAEHAPAGASNAAGAPPMSAPGPLSSGPAASSWSASAPPSGGPAAPPPPPPPQFTMDAGNPYSAPAAAAPVMLNSGVSPGLAFVLGLVPGVGAIYNGQYVKGLVHAAIFGLFATIAQHGDPMTGILMAAFFCYMPFEAYHTARKRLLGVRVEEWSSLMPNKAPASTLPMGPILLILIGVLFLLNSLNVLDMHAVVRFWPLLLIVGGIVMLLGRLRPSRSTAHESAADFQAAPVSEAARERR